MYLLPIDKRRDVLKKCHACLRPGGKLLLKEMDPSVGWKMAICRLEETLAVKVFGRSYGHEFAFPPRHEVRDQLEHAGFAVEEVALHHGYAFPHHLWIGSK
jgi:hypothetical protein